MKKITPASFGYKIAKVMDNLKSSHVYFVIQRAYGDIAWDGKDGAQGILDEVIKQYRTKR